MSETETSPPTSAEEEGPSEDGTSAEGVLESGMAGAGFLRWAAAEVTAPLQYVTRRLDLSPVAAAALGRGMAGVAMMRRLSSKRATRLHLEIRSEGPLRMLLAEADAEGNLRGAVGEPRVDVPNYPNGKLAVGVAVGEGRLRVVRREPDGSWHDSQVALVSGEIGDDLAHFLEQSEQTRSAVLVGVLTRPGRVAAAGGLIVEPLPGAPEEVLARLEANILRQTGISGLVEYGGIGTVEAVLLDGLDPVVQERQALRYHCRCERGRLLSQLSRMVGDDLDYISEEDQTVSAECSFCGEVHRFGRAEIEAASQVC
jgi:molecular chaperone Hsp33